MLATPQNTFPQRTVHAHARQMPSPIALVAQHPRLAGQDVIATRVALRLSLPLLLVQRPYKLVWPPQTTVDLQQPGIVLVPVSDETNKHRKEAIAESDNLWLRPSRVE